MKHDQRVKDDPQAMPDAQDELIRRLFAQAAQADRDRVPAFSAVLESARARQRRAGQRSSVADIGASPNLFTRRLSVSVGIAAVLAMAVFFGVRWFATGFDRDKGDPTASREAGAPGSSETEPGPSGPKQAPGAAGKDDPGPAAVPPHHASAGGKAPTREKYSSRAHIEQVRDRKDHASKTDTGQESSPSPDNRLAAARMATWRSPTGFLLRTPGDEMMKSVPRLDDSLVRVKLLVDKN